MTRAAALAPTRAAPEKKARRGAAPRASIANLRNEANFDRGGLATGDRQQAQQTPAARVWSRMVRSPAIRDRTAAAAAQTRRADGNYTLSDGGLSWLAAPTCTLSPFCDIRRQRLA